MTQQFRLADFLFAGAFWAWLAIGCAALAQPPEKTDGDSAAEQPSEASAKSVLPGETLPEVFYLKDKDGNLQAVPGLSFERFEQLYRIKNQLDEQGQQPKISLQKLTILGSVSGERADLTVRASVVAHDAGWVSLPLRMNSAVLREEAAFDGPGDHFLHFHDQGAGYVAWLRGPAESKHEITLKLWARVAQVGAETRLPLDVPKAVLSLLQLQVPQPQVRAKVSEGSTLESVRALDGGKTELKVAGLGGDFELAWHAAELPLANVPTVLECSGALRVHINGRRVNTEATLTVRSFGGEFDRFQVRLPPGADYIGTIQGGFSAVAVDPTSTKGKVYEVRLEKKTSGPVDVRLVTERIHHAPQNDTPLELAGFEVLGAGRQWGTVALAVEGDLRVAWAETNQVRPFDDLNGLTQRGDVTEGFEYFTQPYSLRARIVPQKTRVRVEPEYLLLISGDEARLVAKLKYAIRGAKVRHLELEMAGWEIDSVGPENLVDVDAVADDQAMPMSIPLVRPVSGELELTLEAHQKLAADRQISTLLPQPKADAVSPPTVVVLPADNVELTMPADPLTLTPLTVRPPLKIKLPDRQQEPLVFRAEDAAARFIATVRVHQQAISVTVASELDVDERETRVESHLVFQVAYQPTDHLTLMVPRAVKPTGLAITLDGQRLVPTALREANVDPTLGVPLRLTLPAPRIGRCELLVSYQIASDKPADPSGSAQTVPLVLPREVQLTNHELTLTTRPGISVAVPQGPWSQEERPTRATGATGIRLTAKGSPAGVAIVVTAQTRKENVTTVERAWIQTQLTDSHRVDRALFRFTSGEPRLTFSLPGGADLGSLQIHLDGRPIVGELDRQRELAVVLPGSERGEHLIELRYHFSDRPALGDLSLEAPRLTQANWIQQIYWQLVLPTHEHVFLAPTHYTAEWSWNWVFPVWCRESLMSSRDLENWIGLTDRGSSVPPHGEPPAAAANVYLFSSVGQAEPLTPSTLSRARLVFLGSLPLLVVGLLLIYFPILRQPTILFAMAVVVAAGGLIDPQLALLVAQASSLGLLLVLVAVVLWRLGGSRPRAVPVAMPIMNSSKALERTSTELYTRDLANSSQPSAAASPLVPSSSSRVNL